MSIKRIQRDRRGRKSRAHTKALGVEKGYASLKIYRSNSNIYAQIVSPVGGKVMAQASSLDSSIRQEKSEDGKKGIARIVGQLLAQRAKEAGVGRVACDRSGYKYHGRVAALVSAARDNGLVV